MAVLNDLLPFLDDIVTFFRDLYWRAVDVINHVTEWINAARQSAFEWAAQIGLAIKNELYTYIIEQIKVLRGFIFTEIENIKALFNPLINEAIKLASSLYNRALEVINTVKVELIEIFNVGLKFLRGELFTAIAPFYDTLTWIENQGKFLYNRLYGLASFIDNIRLTQIIDFFTNRYDSVVSFIQNPYATISVFWHTRLWRFLQYYLAYQMGTLEDELPKWPDDLK